MVDIKVQSWDLMGRSIKKDVPAAPNPDAVWKLPGGTAWVYYGFGNRGLVCPVILSDGFHQGGTDLDEIWNGLERGKYAFASNLRSRRCDLVIVGYDDCTASIFDNARAVTECIFRSIAERMGSAPLAVGGFSMGGLITRYVLAKLEMERMDHQTATYISYDSPHHGAWMPIGLRSAPAGFPRSMGRTVECSSPSGSRSTP